MNIEYSLLGDHGNLLRLRSMRAEIIAGNIANANTPNYKSMDFDVRSVLQSKDENHNLVKTNSKHISISSNSKMAIDFLYRNPNQQSLDGNTVEVDSEIRELTENNIRYQYSIKSISDKIKQIKDILRDI
jgi:flagellar basal-body rod protein FlgB